MKSGIYLIQCGDKKYVGQAQEINKRWTKHISALKSNIHPNHYLQNVWNKYGEEGFTFSILEYCDVNSLNDREVFWINKLNTLVPNGMNLMHGGNVKTHSEETKQKMRETAKTFLHLGMKGKTHSEETKKKQSEIKKGILKSEEAKKNMSIAQSGKKLSKETKQKLSLAGKNRTHSEATKQKMSDSQKGEKNHNFGKVVSEETRIKMSKANKGKVYSEQAIKKMSDARKAYWANKKKGG